MLVENDVRDNGMIFELSKTLSSNPMLPTTIFLKNDILLIEGLSNLGSLRSKNY